jgi:hypothetical protein
MTADEILKKYEDDNEHHFHDVDRRWIIEAMEEYAALQSEFELNFCETCFQMTNHIGSKCQKCRQRSANEFNGIANPHFDSNGHLDGGWIIQNGKMVGHIDPRGEPGTLGEPGVL